jgi:hypothetical protein
MEDPPIERHITIQDSITEKKKSHMHASSGIRTHDRSGPAVQVHTAPPLEVFLMCCLLKHRDNLTFNVEGPYGVRVRWRLVKP